MSKRTGPSRTGKRKILLVDDHPVLRDGFGKLIDNEKDLKICGEADGAPKALDLIKSLQPELVIVDIALNGSNGIDLVKRINMMHPDIPMLVFSAHEEKLYAQRALRAGAKGY